MSNRTSYPVAFLLSFVAIGSALCQAPQPAVIPSTGNPGSTPGAVTIPGPASNPGYAPSGSYSSQPGYYGSVPGMFAPPTMRAPSTTGTAGSDGTAATSTTNPDGSVTPIPDAYITYPQPYCCGPIGGNGPIMMEIYWRAGTATPVGGTRMARALITGYALQGGGRTLFFNPERDAAWTVDLGLGNTYNQGKQYDIPFLVGGSPATVTAQNRTYVTVGFGREYYLLHPVTCGMGNNWRAGFDGGGRYGTVRDDTISSSFTPSGYARLNDRMGALYGALHTDYEIPCGCCTFTGGLRLEWEYDYMSVFGGGSNLQVINCLFQGGVRF